MPEHSPETALQRLYGLQTDPTSRWRATVLAGALGALLATVHWSGILLGGALVGLAWPTLRRALLALAGALANVVAMGVLGAVPLAVPLVGGPLGAVVRGLFPDLPGGN